MFRAFPVRTSVFTVGPLAIALAQIVNASVHGTGFLAVAAVGIVMAAFSVMVTRYHLTSFRRRRLYEKDW